MEKIKINLNGENRSQLSRDNDMSRPSLMNLEKEGVPFIIKWQKSLVHLPGLWEFVAEGEHDKILEEIEKYYEILGRMQDKIEWHRDYLKNERSFKNERKY